MRRLLRGEGGSATAEFALTLPAVVLVLVLGVGALHAASTQVRLQDAVADAARLLSRGEPDARVRAVVASAEAAASLRAAREGDLVCATATVPVRVVGFIELELGASSCALDGGW